MTGLLTRPIGTRTGPGRPWLRWLALAAFVIGLSVTFVNLGFWQLDRLDQRRARNAAVVAHENAPVVDFATVFVRPIIEADQWQRVRVTGTFDAARQFLIRYRSNGGAAGFEVVTPLRTAAGANVLVDRGFVARPANQDFPSVLPMPPTGEVTVVGHVRRAEQGTESAVTPNGNQVRLINSRALAAVLPYPLVDGYVGLLTVTPAQEGGFVPVQPPDLTEGSHLSYALQWFMFTGLAGVGMVVLIRSDLRDRQGGRRSHGSDRTQRPSPLVRDVVGTDPMGTDRNGETR